MNLWLTIKVEISTAQWAYQGTSAEAELKTEAPRNILENLDPGDFLPALMTAALADLDSKLLEGKEDETEETSI